MPFRSCIAAAVLMAACHAQAQDTQRLEACLAAFDDIIGSLPYSPRLSAGNCQYTDNSAEIEFFMHEVPVSDTRRLDYDSRYAAQKKALFVFFEQLFIRHGYQLLNTETDPDARQPYVQRAVFQRRNGDSVAYNATANVCRLSLKKAGRP
jgi:hypothetical protein